MAGRSRSTFKKSQKEIARKEKQSQKAERRVQRKLEKLTQPAGDGESDDLLLPDEVPAPGEHTDMHKPDDNNPPVS